MPKSPFVSLLPGAAPVNAIDLDQNFFSHRVLKNRSFFNRYQSVGCLLVGFARTRLFRPINVHNSALHAPPPLPLSLYKYLQARFTIYV